MAIVEADAAPQTPFEQDVAAMQRYFDSPRFEGIIRLYSARQVVEQRGTIPTDYPVARQAAGAFFDRLRELFAQRKSITTFGPYSPGQAVTMKRMGIEGIYLGGWATSAKGSTTEDPGPDLASYPLSQVPESHEETQLTPPRDRRQAKSAQVTSTRRRSSAGPRSGRSAARARRIARGRRGDARGETPATAHRRTPARRRRSPTA